MASTLGVFGQVIHFVYTWLPRTARNYQEKKKDSRQGKKRVNFLQPLNNTGKSETSSPMVAILQSSHGLPSTPNASSVLILRRPRNAYPGQAELSEEFSSCNLKVVGSKFLSNEKKMSKRSALKRWLRKKTNLVHEENIHYEGQFNCGRHDLCSKEIFECSPKLDDSKYQNSSLGLKGKRRLPPLRQWSREGMNKTIEEELDEIGGNAVDFRQSISVIRVRPSYAE